jgi:hypothetical protein
MAAAPTLRVGYGVLRPVPNGHQPPGFQAASEAL